MNRYIIMVALSIAFFLAVTRPNSGVPPAIQPTTQTVPITPNSVVITKYIEVPAPTQAQPSPTARAEQSTATSVQTVPRAEAAISRIRIPEYEVDAPVITMGIDDNGVMEAPEKPTDVAWYDFTNNPSSGRQCCNAVFAGHVDSSYSGDPGPAVFWPLKYLVRGDVVEVEMEDGTVYHYQVVSNELVDAATADVGEIIGPTQKETVTLITCGGHFNQVTHHHEGRVIVKAEKVP
ncbi:MAG: class F sortase [Candidatus Woykebacteria bacterium]